MSRVPKGRRNQTNFQAEHHLFKLRDDVTELIFNNFGYSHAKYQRMIDRFAEWHKNEPNVEMQISNMEDKQHNFDNWFVRKEADIIFDLLGKITIEFTTGNSIYPSDTPAKLLEFFTRRIHINRAIGYCYALKQELNYVIRTLPVDINKYEAFADSIDEQIKLFKGVRKSDAKRIRLKKNQHAEDVQSGIERILDGAIILINKIKSYENTT